MKSFGSLLQRLRGATPRKEMAQRLGISNGYLANLEKGLRIPDERHARRLLEQGYRLKKSKIDRLLLEVHLFDAGLKDPELREFVLDLVLGRMPADLYPALRRLYRSYHTETIAGPPTEQ